MDEWIKRIFGWLRLTHEREDFDIIHQSIEKAIVFRGTNLWILIFATFIASVGLNMNSTAVIIGAMLISPLMGPINGVGYSIATYDFALLRKSLNNYAFAAGAGLVASTVYFMITPIHSVHSELLARTSPTIYDVFIAMFGGLAGIVAISSKNKGNVIPGVAIATALMPPLCTAGYGLSIWNWNFVLGALYLFLINSVFIALSSMLVSQLMKFPKKSFLLSREIKNTRIVVAIVIFVTVTPSVYLGITLINKERFTVKADDFVKAVSVWEGNYLLRNTIDAEEREIDLVYGGNEFGEDAERRLREKALDMGLEGTDLKVQQGLKIKNYEELMHSDDQFEQLNGEINRLKSALFLRERQMDSLQRIPGKGQQLLKEIRTIFPEIQSCSYANSQCYVDSLGKMAPATLVYFSVEDDFPEENRAKVEKWLLNRLDCDQLILKF